MLMYGACRGKRTVETLVVKKRLYLHEIENLAQATSGQADAVQREGLAHVRNVISVGQLWYLTVF